MNMPVVKLPQLMPQQRLRPPQDNIPQTREEREWLKEVVRDFIAEANPVPPVPMEELKVLADSLIETHKLQESFRDYIAVLMNNQMWEEDLATVPFERRLLLMPKCLREEAKCPAPFDEFGLLCKTCGLCAIQDLQEEAERLGYAVLVAEGSAIVMAIIETGKIDAIVGVSCLSVLEKSFPYMEAAAIPGVAVPLLQDDCADTNVDMEWVWDIMHLTSEDKSRRMNLDALRREVETWFTEESLTEIMGPASDETRRIAQSWMNKAGKRWRPFLTACVYRAFNPDQSTPIPDDLKKLAVAVECFHKASLIHDDIEDDDAERYGQDAVHTEYGVPIALNVGDLLLGDGYRLIAEVQADPAIVSQMLQVAALGHRELCLGQGAELVWDRSPKPLKSTEVIGIFNQKTAPAFEVALQIGALYSGADEEIRDVLSEYSEAIGIGYQIQDDLGDWDGEKDGPGDAEALRPNVLLAIAHEMSTKDTKKLLASVWSKEVEYTDVADQLNQAVEDLGVRERAERLLEAYQEQAIRSLRFMENQSLKGLLRRVIGKIFHPLEIKGWCREFETRNAEARDSAEMTVTEDHGEPTP